MVKSKGLGDSLEKFTEKTGIKKIVKKVLGEDCGCEKRKKWLNNLYPYARQFTNDEMKVYESVLPRIKGGVIQRNDQIILLTLYNKVFKANKQPSSCGSCVSELLDKLKKIHENSCDIKNG